MAERSDPFEHLKKLRESDKRVTNIARTNALGRRLGGTQRPAGGRPQQRSSAGSAGGSAAEYQAYARKKLAERGIGDDNNMSSLVNLWNKESNWNPNATNRSSGAYGIAQMMPMHGRAEGAQAQIDWGIDYILRRYGSPSAAWGHSQRTDWY